ncbi:hypothetical protein [Candidatus Pantoea formicae]|uniref:hypothetical protein n=1 Tax=Candidatus Pantoea formicae TaxID=2608355 RepID=UPI003ED9640F
MKNKPDSIKPASPSDKQFVIELPVSEFDRKMHGFMRWLFIIAIAVFIVGMTGFIIRDFI